IGAVEQEGDVVLLGDVRGTCDQHLLDNVSLDVEPEDGARLLLGVGRAVSEFDASGLAAATGLDLGLHNHRAPDSVGGGTGGLRLGDDFTGLCGDTVLGEQFLGLVLVKIHCTTSSIETALACDATAWRYLRRQVGQDTGVDPRLALTHSTTSSVGVPGVKTLATPKSASGCRSSSGMMPPPKTTMSSM